MYQTSIGVRYVSDIDLVQFTSIGASEVSTHQPKFIHIGDFNQSPPISILALYDSFMKPDLLCMHEFLFSLIKAIQFDSDSDRSNLGLKYLNQYTTVTYDLKAF